MHIVKNNLLKFHTFHLDMPILILILMLSFIKSVLCYTENQDTLEIDKSVEIPKKRKIDVDDKSDVSSQETDTTAHGLLYTWTEDLSRFLQILCQLI